MMKRNKNLILNDNINMELLLNSQKKPDLYAANEEPFWDDPHISQQMLEAHLNPAWDAASYNHKTIDQIVEWMVKYLDLKENAKILDLGCGPGLYCTRFSRHGLDVVGMDYSRNSISYAKKYAETNCLNIQYIYQDYLTMDYSCEFDAIFLIYCDFGALSDCRRDLLLQKIQKALKPDGIFVFDVFTRFNWEQQSMRNWYVSEAGFWRPYPHLVLEQTFHYEEENVFLNQYTVIDSGGEVSAYNLSDHYYSKQDILQLMKEHGYQVQDVWSNLTGKDYAENTKCLGVASKKLVK
ncbi:class I SAM-dependent methyltransferase [Anaerocolumna xylanovorans]|uniref:Methyltransferase domain-containing protein n=1 Tax=Anaerocolumna xylanovorans DSM 12503 TaxID=1121345 RepID=A0A1M7Y4E7_9FIRM|nr:class I SAM-dependent methyltransferase [Anaerocolumna xylanovorans]SHO47009.1 Methyltransferase domain-containing protein [Anaerocolumna xylanovorans DSM 12503]